MMNDTDGSVVLDASTAGNGTSAPSGTRAGGTGPFYKKGASTGTTAALTAAADRSATQRRNRKTPNPRRHWVWQPPSDAEIAAVAANEIVLAEAAQATRSRPYLRRDGRSAVETTTDSLDEATRQAGG